MGYRYAGPWDEGSRGYGADDYPQEEYGQDGYSEGGQASGYGSGQYGQQQQRGYPQSGDYGSSGSYSAGNDWYGGPGGESGGFADTGTYSAVRDPVRGFPPTSGAQPVYTSGAQPAYGDYPAHGGEYDDYAASGDGYGTGYQGGQAGYDSGQAGYGGQAAGYDAYADYQGYDYDGGGDNYAEPAPASDAPRGAARRGAKRRGRSLLLSAVAVVLIGFLGTAAYLFLFNKQSAANNASTSQPLPTVGASSSTPACVAQLGTYCHIEMRGNDPTPLTLSELFSLPSFQNETDHASFTKVAAKIDKTCSDAVYGQDLKNALSVGKCTQLLRATYVSGNGKIMGTVGVANLVSTNKAHTAGKTVGASDFVLPLASSKGVAKNIANGTGVVDAEFKGHYLILTWAIFVNGDTPSTQAQIRQLKQFSSDLVAGTANISLSERMVTGVPGALGG